MIARTRTALVAGGAALVAALAPATTLGTPRNLVADHVRVTPGCPGFTTSSSSPEGLSFQYGTPNGACSIGTPWGTTVAQGAQGRVGYDAPRGARIAAWRGVTFRVQGQGGAPASTEVFVNDASGEYQVADWSSTTFDWRSQSFTPRHPAGAGSVFFLMRSHGRFTPGPTDFRQLDLNAGAIDLWDEEAPTIRAVSVDGGDAWSSAPARTLRMTIDDNLGAGGIALARVQAGAAILRDDVAPAPGEKAYDIDVGALGDGAHLISSVVVNSGVGDLGAVWGPHQVVRLDRTAPDAADRRGRGSGGVGPGRVAPGDRGERRALGRVHLRVANVGRRRCHLVGPARGRHLRRRKRRRRPHPGPCARRRGPRLGMDARDARAEDRSHAAGRRRVRGGRTVLRPGAGGRERGGRRVRGP